MRGAKLSEEEMERRYGSHRAAKVPRSSYGILEKSFVSRLDDT